jgi:hypothetical protein
MKKREPTRAFGNARHLKQNQISLSSILKSAHHSPRLLRQPAGLQILARGGHLFCPAKKV